MFAETFAFFFRVYKKFNDIDLKFLFKTKIEKIALSTPFRPTYGIFATILNDTYVCPLSAA